MLVREGLGDTNTVFGQTDGTECVEDDREFKGYRHALYLRSPTFCMDVGLCVAAAQLWPKLAEANLKTRHLRLSMR